MKVNIIVTCPIFRKEWDNIVVEAYQAYQAKYFLIKDYYDAGEVDLGYCPTGCMGAVGLQSKSFLFSELLKLCESM